jgi:hypothetical protein
MRLFIREVLLLILTTTIINSTNSRMSLQLINVLLLLLLLLLHRQQVLLHSCSPLLRRSVVYIYMCVCVCISLFAENPPNVFHVTNNVYIIIKTTASDCCLKYHRITFAPSFGHFIYYCFCLQFISVLGGHQVMLHLFPVDNLPPFLDIDGSLVLILQIIGMLPDINSQYWHQFFRGKHMR